MQFDQLKRREFVTLVGGAATWPLAAQAQDTGGVRRLGMLLSFRENDPEIQSRIQAFTTELEKLGWRVGRNLQIDYRWGANEVASAQTAAAELLGLGPDLVLAQNTPAAAALQQATRSIPIVFVGVGDPVVQGFVANLARPGGNLTGFSHGEPTMAGKWVELLKELAPRVTRVTEILNPKTSPYAELSFRTVGTAAQKFAIEAAMADVRESADIEAVMTRLAREPGSGLIFPMDVFTTRHRKMIIELAARHRLPAIYAFRFFVAEGGLIAYGNDPAEQFRPAAAYVDRILRGEKPADLPVQQPTKFELVINLKTANALGLTVPPTLLVAADEVIE